MKTYIFRHMDGHISTVHATNEKDARDLAMFQRWGRPDGRVLLTRPYKGVGLSLVNVS